MKVSSVVWDETLDVLPGKIGGDPVAELVEGQVAELMAELLSSKGFLQLE